MPENIDIEKTITEAVNNPASVAIDGQTISQHNLKDLIEADKYLESKKTSRSTRIGIKIFKMIRGGFND